MSERMKALHTLAEALEVIRPRRNGEAVVSRIEAVLPTLPEGERRAVEAEIIRVARLAPLYDAAKGLLAPAGLSPHPLVGRRVLGKVMPW